MTYNKIVIHLGTNDWSIGYVKRLPRKLKKKLKKLAGK